MGAWKPTCLGCKCSEGRSCCMCILPTELWSADMTKFKERVPRAAAQAVRGQRHRFRIRQSCWLQVGVEGHGLGKML